MSITKGLVLPLSQASTTKAFAFVSFVFAAYAIETLEFSVFQLAPRENTSFFSKIEKLKQKVYCRFIPER